MSKQIGQFQHRCQPEDNECWRKLFGNIIQCTYDDPQCWRKRFSELPCHLDDIHCWKTKIPELPCEYTDFQCLQNKLPPLPCKLLDTVCWERYIKNRNEDGSKKTDQGIEPKAHKRPLNWVYQVDAGENSFGS